MSISIRFLACLALGASLAAIPLSSLAATRSWQFAVMVRVLPHCQWSLPSEYAGGGRFTMECTRDTGYVVSVSRGDGSRSEAHPAIISGVGSGTQQVFALRVPPAAFSNVGPSSEGPLFLTINY